jgi:AcrR family transcriptional regulator
MIVESLGLRVGGPQAISPRMPKESASARVRKRLSPELRRGQIMDAAVKLIVSQGFLPLPIERLAQDAGASKALIYTYFPTQYDLFNTLLERELNSLAVGGLDTAVKVDDLEQALILCGMLYFEHVVQYGPLLHILLSDLFMAGHIHSRVTGVGEEMSENLVRLLREELSLSKKEALAAIEMLASIPEESGSLAFHGDMEAVSARAMCRDLILSSLKGLRSADKIFARIGEGDGALKNHREA